MSQGELVGAYLEGQISRRTLVRRLVGGGVSLGAALSYAQVLKPERAFAGGDSDHYPDTTVRLISTDIDDILDRNKLIYRVRADEDAELFPLLIRSWHKVGQNYTKIGEREFTFEGPKVKNVGVPLLPAAGGLSAYDKAKISTYWIGFDQQGKLPNGSFISTITQ